MHSKIKNGVTHYFIFEKLIAFTWIDDKTDELTGCWCKELNCLTKVPKNIEDVREAVYQLSPDTEEQAEAQKLVIQDHVKENKRKEIFAKIRGKT